MQRNIMADQWRKSDRIFLVLTERRVQEYEARADWYIGRPQAALCIMIDEETMNSLLEAKDPTLEGFEVEGAKVILIDREYIPTSGKL